MKVLLRCSLQSSRDTGQDSFELIRALLQQGMSVFLDPIDVEAPLPQDIAGLLTQVHPGYYDLAIDYTFLENVGIDPKFRKKSEYSIAWVYHDKDKSSKHGLRNQLSKYNLIVAQDENTYNVLESYTEQRKDADEILRVIQPSGYDSKPWRYIDRDWNSETFSFLVVSEDRRGDNVEATIEAYSKLISIYDIKNVRLTIKTTPEDDLNPALVESIPGLVIYKTSWSKDNYKYFYGLYHAIICADTGGNKNLRALQFLSTGGTALATNWSLNKNWLSKAYSYPLAFDFLGKDTRMKTQNEAYVNVGELCDEMKHAVQNRQSVQRSGSIASQTVPAMLDWNHVIESLFRNIAETGDAGDRLRNKLLMTKPLNNDNGELGSYV